MFGVILCEIFGLIKTPVTFNHSASIHNTSGDNSSVTSKSRGSTRIKLTVFDTQRVGKIGTRSSRKVNLTWHSPCVLCFSKTHTSNRTALKNEDADYNLSICAQPAYADMTKIQWQIGGRKSGSLINTCKICIQLSYYFMRQRKQGCSL